MQQRFRAAIDRTEHCLAVAGRVEQVRLLVDYQGWAEVDLGQAVADEGQFGNDAFLRALVVGPVEDEISERVEDEMPGRDLLERPHPVRVAAENEVRAGGDRRPGVGRRSRCRDRRGREGRRRREVDRGSGRIRAA